jgi:hypothetical protein
VRMPASWSVCGDRFGSEAAIRECPLCAMCGRLSVGKGFLDAVRFGRCGHVFDLLVRRAWPLAIMPFAETGPDQKHAL